MHELYEAMVASWFLKRQEEGGMSDQMANFDRAKVGHFYPKWPTFSAAISGVGG